MARRSASKTFVAPRGEDGKFVPRDQWSKKTRKEFDRLRKQGAFKGVKKNPAGIKKNPIVKSKRGRRSGKNIWIPPHDKAGRFLPMAQWTAADKKAYRKALKDGLVPGSLVPRGQTGRFASDGSGGTKRARKSRESVRPQDELYDADDLYSIRRGVRRLEHRFDDLLDEIDRARTRPRREVGAFLSAPLDHDVCASGSCESHHHHYPTEVTQEDEPEFGYVDPRAYDFEAEVDEECRKDHCHGAMLARIDQVDQKCRSSIEQLSRHTGLARNRAGGLARNSSSRLMMYNRPRTVGQRFEQVLGYLKEHPVVAIVGMGAIALIGFALYKMIRTIMSNMISGASIRQGVISFPGSDPYFITQEDSLWLIRAIWGEVNRSNDHWDTAGVQRGAAAVMWALANNYMTVGAKRQHYPTFAQFIQAYCQPINPIWSSPGASGCQRNPDACTADRLAFRQALRSKPWAQFPSAAQALVTAFVAGTLQNPIGRRTDWAAAGEGRTTADAVNIANNVFITDPTARSRVSA